MLLELENGQLINTINVARVVPKYDMLFGTTSYHIVFNFTCEDEIINTIEITEADYKKLREISEYEYHIFLKKRLEVQTPTYQILTD